MRKKTSLQIAYGKFRSTFIATIVFSFFTNLLMFVGPLYMLQVYDRVLSSRNEMTLVMISVIAVALLVSYGLLEFTRSRLLVRAGMQFDEVLANPVFHRVVKQQTTLPGSNAQIALRDIDKVREFMTGQGILAFFDAPWVPLFLALCFAFHPLLGAVATVGAVLIFILALTNEFATRIALEDASKAAQGANHFVNTTMQNAEVIRALGMEKQLTKRWLDQHDEMLAHQAKASDRAGSIMASSKFIRMSLQIAILGTGAYLAIHQLISPGIMIAASIMMGRALAPVEQAVGQWKQFVAARSSHKRLKELFTLVPDQEERTELPAPKGRLIVEQLFATVPGTRDTLLKGISFSVDSGEILAVIGPSGSGKTSLVRHLVGAMNPVSGAVRLDGTEMQHWDPDQVGRYIGYLPQDVKLFGGSVAENVSRFAEEPKDADIIAAATLSGAHEMIQKLNDGYETNVGDGGMFLSGGQRQRVGLARAVYRDPSLVILDEPNSNLDNVGEQALVDCIQELKKMNKTVILVTHKTNLLALSDKTLMLVNGAVEKFGPTEEFFQKPQAASGATRTASQASGRSPAVLQLSTIEKEEV
ncbi:type I secretion system permease/ATPase [Sulfitobacter pseudonitzschiae]|uniref:Type I secretion system permease/ATPase n=1 Tax=Pseudosulfitobacter pseudonitzschiae TaxID=1402135 RepID=A0A9Q2NN58_9RHOB|nr:type I secretion system permease/ATPase [Pseudosulfitobacter pseudonitzschiae]MBM2295075.1 type I secretion system permease/ATPase [Pseudosulfitobacter pseudonitzschiae]MBM2299997.1 type I secretion system permease/ATPase [Pseudosulfitobacter pseudonitzschiae]MBM2304913.1 type I secretion system permease/ATPase [Pseudosulfitobacter pseudonitzschiae]MBM2314686.1 type I secretion system permease/ATPase [Pseudosulfitobacter pseudonitzschiae]MBM2319594.1 type I secretion system permease/ATPase 